MNELSCEICMDLIPLVQDGAASDDSQKAVAAHTAHCEECQALLTQAVSQPRMDDGHVLGKLRQRLAVGALILMVVGAFLGVGLSNSQAVFYNILIMPAIGALSYVALGKKAFLAPLVLFAIAFLLPALQRMPSGGWDGWDVYALLFWAVIYCGLCVLGIVIAALFYFAFRKDGTENER